MRLPPFARTALLLDLDGTLLDIAPTPDSVVVPPGLIAALDALRARLGDAVAVVSGRPVEQVDALLGGVPYAVAGEHGGAFRPAPGAALRRPELADLPEGWRRAGERIAAAHPGTLLERKARGFVLHYRAAPAHGPALRAALAALAGDDAGFVVMRAHMAWELKPAGADKGTAVRVLLEAPPFAGRLPLFIGDDVTDEDGIAAAFAAGGGGLRVAEAFGSPQAVRDWLADAAARGDWPALPGCCAAG